MSTMIKGFDKVMSNLNKEIAGIENRSMKGLIEGAIIIERSMDDNSPKVPLDTGNLRSSYYSEPFKTNSGMPAIRLGFAANYAWWVHENVGANFRRPGAGAKFFEAALKREQDAILEAIRRNAKV